jgi:hypothetical protein
MAVIDADVPSEHVQVIGRAKFRLPLANKISANLGDLKCFLQFDNHYSKKNRSILYLERNPLFDIINGSFNLTRENGN